MADKTMHHVVIGDDTFELIDEAGREETTALKEDFDGIVGNIAAYNAGEFLQFGEHTDKEFRGVSYTFNADGSCTVITPTVATNNSVYNYYVDTNKLPPYIIRGETYNVEFSGTNVSFRVYEYVNGVSTTIFDKKTSGSFTVSSNSTGLQILLYVKSGTAVNETVDPKIKIGTSNKTLNSRTKLQFLVSGTDLNDIYMNGTYSLSNSKEYLNVPIELQTGRRFLYVSSIDSETGVVNQIIVDDTTRTVYVRYHADNAWSDWKSLTDPKEIYQNLLFFNSVEVLEYCNKQNNTSQAVDFSFNADGSCTVIGTATNNTAIHDYLSSIDALPYWIIPGHKYYLRYSATMVLFRIYFYKNGEQLGSTISVRSDTEFVVPSDATGIVLRLAVNKNQTVNETVNPKLYSGISNTEIANKLKNIPDTLTTKLKVCSFNIGLYNYGMNSVNHPRQYVNAKIAAVTEFLASNDFDIIGCQENNQNLGTSENPIYTNDIFTGAYPYFYRGEFSLTVASKYPLVNGRTGYFTNSYVDNDRGWLIVETVIDGKRIAVTNCHPAWQNDDDAAVVRALQKAELMQMVAGYDYVIMFGDWNAYSSSEFTDFVTAGYTLSNGGYLDFENTQPTLDPLYPLDNIIIRADTSAKSFRKVLAPVKIANPTTTEDERDLYVSDHLPIQAILTIV